LTGKKLVQFAINGHIAKPLLS